MNSVDRKLGEIIRTRRKEMRLTQPELARRVGTTAQCIYYYEKGLRGVPMSIFFKLCDVLELEPNEIHRLVK